MTLPIGSKPVALKNNRWGKHGFSFVEVMVALAILSGGVVFIYKSFLISLDYIHHLACRSYALTLLDNKINYFQQIFAAKKEILFNQQDAGDEVTINNRKVYFRYEMDFKMVEKLKNIYQLDISLAWNEGNRHKQLARQVYIANYDPVTPTTDDESETK